MKKKNPSFADGKRACFGLRFLKSRLAHQKKFSYRDSTRFELEPIRVRFDIYVCIYFIILKYSKMYFIFFNNTTKNSLKNIFFENNHIKAIHKLK